MTRPADLEFAPLLTGLYDAVLDPTKWQPMAGKIATAFGIRSCVLMTHEKDGSGATMLSMTDNIAENIQGYVTHYYKFDEFAIRGAAKGLGEVVIGSELITERELIRTEFYEFLRKTDTSHMIGAALPATSGQTAFVGVHSGQYSADFSRDQARQMKMLLAHIQRALQLREQLGIVTAQRNAALDSLDRMSTAAIIVDAAGRIVVANKLAIASCERATG